MDLIEKQVCCVCLTEQDMIYNNICEHGLCEVCSYKIDMKCPLCRKYIYKWWINHFSEKIAKSEIVWNELDKIYKLDVYNIYAKTITTRFLSCVENFCQCFSIKKTFIQEYKEIVYVDKFCDLIFDELNYKKARNMYLDYPEQQKLLEIGYENMCKIMYNIYKDNGSIFYEVDCVRKNKNISWLDETHICEYNDYPIPEVLWKVFNIHIAYDQKYILKEAMEYIEENMELYEFDCYIGIDNLLKHPNTSIYKLLNLCKKYIKFKCEANKEQYLDSLREHLSLVYYNSTKKEKLLKLFEKYGFKIVESDFIAVKLKK